MGGKNPAIVAASADLDAAAAGIASSAYGFSGQKCSACSRAIVRRQRPRRAGRAARRAAAALAVGDPADRDAFTGPVIDERAVERFAAAVAEAGRDGQVVAGGRALDLPGHFVAPTVVAGLPAGHRLTREELFVPFVTVTRVGSFDEALAEANAIDYGLTAGVFSRERRRARPLPRRDRGRRRLRQPARRRDDRRVARLPVVLRLEEQRLDGQGRARPVLRAAVHARAEPHDRLRLSCTYTHMGIRYRHGTSGDHDGRVQRDRRAAAA